MSGVIDIDQVPGLREKFEELADVFQRFNFPSQPNADSLPEKDYLMSVLNLYSINPKRLDWIAEESLQEWNLRIDMGQCQESDEFYLLKFISTLDVAIHEDHDALSSCIVSLPNGTQSR